MKSLLSFTFLGLLLANGAASAQSFTLPLQLDYSLIKKLLVSQLYTGNEQSVKVWHDKHDCSHLTLSNPQIGGQDGQLRMQNHVAAQFGTEFGGQCVTVLKWIGELETFQQPTLSADGSVLNLPVTKVTAYDGQGRPLEIAKLQDLLRKVAEPKLAALAIDLKKSQADIERTLGQYVSPAYAADIKPTVESLKFASATANDHNIAVSFSFDAPTKVSLPSKAAALTASEEKQSQQLWQQWHSFLTKTMEQASKDSDSKELRSSLKTILASSERAFHAGLKDHDANGEDPVRVFFTETWDNLSPVLRTLAKQLPEAQALQYLTFIAATDVMYELDAIGSPFGLSISSDGLRNLVRILIAGKQQTGEKSH